MRYKYYKGSFHPCGYDAANDRCQLRTHKLCTMDPSPAPAASQPATCSALILLPAREWCNSDPARRNDIACPKFSQYDNAGTLKQCGYNSANGECRMRAAC
jgi:hypothetical protein